jgi:hypothetical protein
VNDAVRPKPVIHNCFITIDLDFGKTQASPTDKLGSIVEELVKKIPNQKP